MCAHEQQHVCALRLLSAVQGLWHLHCRHRHHHQHNPVQHHLPVGWLSVKHGACDSCSVVNCRQDLGQCSLPTLVRQGGKAAEVSCRSGVGCCFGDRRCPHVFFKPAGVPCLCCWWWCHSVVSCFILYINMLPCAKNAMTPCNLKGLKGSHSCCSSGLSRCQAVECNSPAQSTIHCLRLF